MTKNNLLIVWHGGLGDHIICNAIVRAKAEIYDLVCLPVKYTNCPSVIYMFRDLDNVTIRPVYGDEDMLVFRDQVWKGEVLNLGAFSGLGFTGADWDCEFFRHAGVEFTDRWQEWHCQRDEVAENRLIESEMVLATDYGIFIHHDTARGMEIKRDHVSVDTPHRNVILPRQQQTNILFHWRKVIEACDEIHVIPSSFAAFIDSIPLPKSPKLFLHHYTRRGEPLMKINKEWEVLK
jgi:hypothetical protein